MPGISTSIGIPFGGAPPFAFDPAEAPSGLTATIITDTQVDLVWTSNSAGIEEGFSIERSADLGVTYAVIDTTLTGDVNYSDGTVIADTVYYYRVRAFLGVVFSAYSNVATVDAGDWTAYWAANLFDQGDLNFWVKEGTRSGLTLPDTINPGAGDASILTPYFFKDTGNEYLYIADNGALDIGATDFTLAAWIKSETTNKTAYRYLCGKLIASGVNGRYGFFINQTTGYAGAQAQSSGGTVTINGSTDVTAAGWMFMLMEVEQVAAKVRFFINGIQIGVDTAFTGTFAALGNQYEFYIGSGNDATGAGVIFTALSSHSDTYVFKRLLTPTEKTTLLNRGVVTGAKAHWTCGFEIDAADAIKSSDCSGNGYNLTGVVGGTAISHEAYAASGYRQSLNLGYSLYQHQSSMAKIEVPYLDSGIANAAYTPPTGYIKVYNKAGDLTNHNLAKSKIRFAGANWDRSDATIYNAAARLGYYDAGNVKDWHNTELHEFNIYKNFTNANYEGLNFVYSDDDIDIGHGSILELFSYDTNKTGSDLTKILIYITDTSVHTITYDFVNLHICAVRGAKILRFDDVRYLTLSLDGGATTYSTLDLNGVTAIISFAHIFENGNILFASNTKLYLSTDNLTSYAETTVLDIAGAPFTGTLNCFRSLGYQEATVGALKIPVWGPYTLDVATAYININVFYTIDNGVTVKSCYLANTTLTPAAALAGRHVHAVNFNSSDNSWWLQTGDGTDECNWVKGTYDVNTDTWTWTKIAGDNVGGSGATSNNTYYKICGLIFYDDYVYWGSDSNDANKDGIWRCLYTDIADSTKYLKIYDGASKIWSFFDCLNGNMIATEEAGKFIVTTSNGIDFIKNTLTGGENQHPVYNVYVGRNNIKDNQGNIIIDIINALESIETYTTGQIIRARVTDL